MKTITRRTALAVPVTLPLLPVSAYAKPADPLTAKIDNAISDFRRHFENLPPEHRRALAFKMRAAADAAKLHREVFRNVWALAQHGTRDYRKADAA